MVFVDRRKAVDKACHDIPARQDGDTWLQSPQGRTAHSVPSMEWPSEPAIPLLGVYPREPKSAHYSDTGTPMSIAAPMLIEPSYGTSLGA